MANNNPAGGNQPGGNAKDSAGKNNASQTTEISYDGLMKDIPLTAERITQSNEIIATNMVELAKAYQNELEEYRLAADTYEEYLERFPDRLLDGEIYLGLYYCYTKLEDKAKAAHYKNLLNNKFPNLPGRRPMPVWSKRQAWARSEAKIPFCRVQRWT